MTVARSGRVRGETQFMTVADVMVHTVINWVAVCEIVKVSHSRLVTLIGSNCYSEISL